MLRSNMRDSTVISFFQEKKCRKGKGVLDLGMASEILNLTANVFPDPVWATPTIFIPLIAIGQP